MSANIKDLIKQEKERRKLLREERKKAERVKQPVGGEDPPIGKDLPGNYYTESEQQDRLFLKIQNNSEHGSVTQKYNDVEEQLGEVGQGRKPSGDRANSEQVTRQKTSDSKIDKRVHFAEPTAPLNRLNKNNNFRDAFLDYSNEEQSENSEGASKKGGGEKNVQVDLPADFFDSIVTLNHSSSEKNSKRGTPPMEGSPGGKRKADQSEPSSEGEAVNRVPLHYGFSEENEISNDRCASSKEIDDGTPPIGKQSENQFDLKNEPNVEVIETYEITEDILGSAELVENEKFHRQIKKKRKLLQEGEYHLDDEENDEGGTSKGGERTHRRDISRGNVDQSDGEGEQGDPIMNLFTTNLEDLTNYKLLDTAYYEELDYLHKILVEKKKYILGDKYDEEKEESEEREVEVLEELNQFRKKKKKMEKGRDDEEGNDHDSHFNIDEIYDLLKLKRGMKEADGKIAHIFGNTPSRKRADENRDEGKKTNEYENLPRGFFDDKEKDILVRENISLSKINQKIGEIKKQKKNILLEFKTMEKVYEEKKNSYIDYLYDDKFDDKEQILNEIVRKSTSRGAAEMDGLNCAQRKEEQKEGKKGRKKGRKKEKKQEKRNANTFQLDDEHGDIFHWRKKSLF
ncbi:conserved Plasmodium protein, unknown function [Plasmodium vivax]|uniref:Uncharacterized protein n=3 Tax=Plasmodium vivax TaxID=5855 RepID=A5K2F7_PLAVS|nr:hypothetical protein, conserved [Plasmodium vivax]KMZ86022.1 hypothetical protein PVBG_03487 [Plasmodium vivax Brazil I]EDL46607.1 hypothetical protein, conserved [Plasmodium vivax]CAG9477716.1 unnamed protein product [Plasmodium vivax]CAI7721306.1 conserved Plasmodium protein, unknown function [Plasmodium vivax]SCO73535.1 conserved Plasmodium protein, unknown function [Plasmodium vivax]|eukprot:XP_001616334.1 hypothetical protein [Plasmodium vivax Sal-1]